MTTLKQITDALKYLSGADPNVVKAIEADMRLEKAAERATDRDAPYVYDHHSEGHLNRTATKEEIPFGPEQASSGDGAARMVRDYSNFAPQHGITMTAEKLAEMFGPMNSSMKAQTALLLSLGKSLEALLEGPPARGNGAVKAGATATATTTPAAKAEEDDEDDEDDEEESEVVEITEKSAKSLLTKARKLIATAKAKKSEAKDMDDMGEEEKCKALKVEAFGLKKAAAKLLAKARTAAYAAKAIDVEIGKSLIADIRAVAAKADINVTQEDEESEEDEAEKAKKAIEAATATSATAPAAAALPATDAALAAAKAKENDKGNQVDRADPANGNQAAAAAKSSAELAVEKALEGMGMIQSDVKGMMNTIMNASKGSPIVPNFVSKATPEVTSSLTEKLLAMEESGELTGPDVSAAREIISRAAAAKAGHLDPKVVTDRIAKASPTVKSFFEAATAVAA